jgi:hypothetical protein
MENPFKKLSKPEIYVVIVGSAAIAAYAEYRHHKSTGSWSPFATNPANSAANGNAAGTSGGGTVTDPNSGQVYSDTAVDPITNLTYASEIANYGDVATADSQFSTAYGATTGAVQQSAGQTLPGYSSNLASVGTSTITGNDVYTSNSGWAQAATAGLTDVGYDGPTVSAALGAFLTGTPLTPAQVTIVNTAIAEYGRPPQGSLSVIPQPVAKPSPTPVAKPKTGPIPNVVGESASAAAAHLKSRGFKNSGGVAGNDIIVATEPKAGTEAEYGSVVKIIPGKHKIPATESK